MRIAIMGTGAVGGYFGAFLARAGHDVTFIARGAHLAAIRARGLEVTGPRGDYSVRPAKATDDPATVGPVDVVLFCVKLYDTESAARAIAPMVRDGGVCISLQNGVDAQERMGGILGHDKVMGGLAFVSGVIEAPGVIRYVSNMSSIRFGETDGSQSARGIAFRDACVAAGFEADFVTDIRAAQWQKFVGLASNAAMTCLVRQPAGIVYHDPDLLKMAHDAFNEVMAVAKAQGIDVPADTADRLLEAHRNFPPGMYASMYHDLARGRPIELDSLSGLVVRKGRELGVPTPVHAFAYAALKPYLHGTPQLPK